MISAFHANYSLSVPYASNFNGFGLFHNYEKNQISQLRLKDYPMNAMSKMELYIYAMDILLRTTEKQNLSFECAYYFNGHYIAEIVELGNEQFELRTTPTKTFIKVKSSKILYLIFYVYGYEQTEVRISNSIRDNRLVQDVF